MLVEPDAEVQGIEVLVSHPPEGIPRREPPLLFVHGAFAGAWCAEEEDGLVGGVGHVCAPVCGRRGVVQVKVGGQGERLEGWV